MSDAPKVSAVIPTYNNEGTIAGTLESALAQRFDGGVEVIAVNDGSTDGTRAVLQKFGDRIRVIDQENRGVAAARNAGIAAARGKYIALLDGDDTWTEDKIAKSVAPLDNNPECVAVYSNVIQVNAAGRVMSCYVPPEYRHAPTLDEMLKRPWPLLPSAIVIRRSTLVAIGGFREDFGRRALGGEDTFAFLLVREQGEIHFVPDKLVRYRISDARESFVKRAHLAERTRGSRDGAEPGKIFEGHLVFARLVRERFGTRGRAIIRFSFDQAGGSLVNLGMVAMHEGNPAFARRCYLASLQYRPLMLKTYLRLAWATLPRGVSQRLAPMLAPGLRRSLAGPPFSQLQELAAAGNRDQ